MDILQNCLNILNLELTLHQKICHQILCMMPSSGGKCSLKMWGFFHKKGLWPSQRSKLDAIVFIVIYDTHLINVARFHDYPCFYCWFSTLGKILIKTEVIYNLKLLLNWVIHLINPFVPNVPFLHPLKTSENLTGFWFFKEYRKGALGTNGLIDF